MIRRYQAIHGEVGCTLGARRQPPDEQAARWASEPSQVRYVAVFPTSVTSWRNACRTASLSPSLCQSIGTETQGVRLGMCAEISVGRLRGPTGLTWLAGTPMAASSARQLSHASHSVVPQWAPTTSTSHAGASFDTFVTRRAGSLR